MFSILIIIIIIFLVVSFWKLRNYKIKYNTFLHKGIKIKDSRFGVYCYTGKQGSGKTSSAIKFLVDNASDEWPVYANLRSIKNINYHYFNGLESLLSLRDKKHIIIFYDEIFTILSKGSKFNNDILDFLSQMRKREIIFITTAQEWLELPMTLRRYVRYQVDCNILTFPLLPSFNIKHVNDAYRMKWDKDENDYIAPLITCVIEKLNLKVLNSYDTFEQIPTNVNTLPVFIENENGK